MDIKNYNELLNNIEQVLNNYDLDEFSAHFDSEEDFDWLVKHLVDCFE